MLAEVLCVGCGDRSDRGDGSYYEMFVFLSLRHLHSCYCRGILSMSPGSSRRVNGVSSLWNLSSSSLQGDKQVDRKEYLQSSISIHLISFPCQNLPLKLRTQEYTPNLYLEKRKRKKDTKVENAALFICQRSDAKIPSRLAALSDRSN